jgi:hypothetical protein
MSFLRVLAALLLVGITCVPSNANDEISRALRGHSVWLQAGLTWDRAEGETDPHKSYAAGTILYLGPDGKFGVFRGIVIKTGRRLGLSEGDGEAVYSGDWKITSDEVLASYRLISWYKLMAPAGQAPVVPGPTQRSTIRIKSFLKKKEQVWRLEFDGKEYEIVMGLRASELREHLEIHEKHPLGP